MESRLGGAQVGKYICIKQMISTWFWDAPIEAIKKENVADLLQYGFWYHSR